MADPGFHQARRQQEQNNEQTGLTWVIYDGDCPLCRQLAGWLQHRDRRQRLLIRALQTPGLLQRLQIPLEEALAALQLVDERGRRWQGADAVILALAQTPGLGWLRAVWRVTWLRSVARAVYEWVARHRQRDPDECDQGTCPRL